MSPVNLLEERLVQATQNSKGTRRPRVAFILPRSTSTLVNVTCNSLQYTEFYERNPISFLQAFIVTSAVGGQSSAYDPATAMD